MYLYILPFVVQSGICVTISLALIVSPYVNCLDHIFDDKVVIASFVDFSWLGCITNCAPVHQVFVPDATSTSVAISTFPATVGDAFGVGVPVSAVSR